MQKIIGLARAAGLCAPPLSIALLVISLVGCGGGSSTKPAGGPLSGNWQLMLTQEFPRPQVMLSVSGFLNQSSNSITGSVQVPPSTQNGKCAGVGSLTGSVNAQNVTFTIDNGGTTISLTGTLSTDGQSIIGQYSALSGGCYTTPTTGTWTGELIPPLNGTFTGAFSQSQYMQTLTGINPPNPIQISGTFAQDPNGVASNAALTGTLTAVGYPCLRTASLTGTISGQNVVLSVYSYNGNLIGGLGTSSSNPAIVSVVSGKVTLSSPIGGFSLGSGACPVISPPGGGSPLSSDSAAVLATLQ